MSSEVGGASNAEWQDRIKQFAESDPQFRILLFCPKFHEMLKFPMIGAMIELAQSQGMSTEEAMRFFCESVPKFELASQVWPHGQRCGGGWGGGRLQRLTIKESVCVVLFPFQAPLVYSLACAGEFRYVFPPLLYEPKSYEAHVHIKCVCMCASMHT